MTQYYFDDIKNYPNDVNKTILVLKEFTDTYKQYHVHDKEMCEALCLKIQWGAILGNIEKQDLIAGRMVCSAIGFSPQSNSAGFGYFYHEPSIEALLADPEITEENRNILLGLWDFWKTEDFAFKTRQT